MFSNSKLWYNHVFIVAVNILSQLFPHGGVPDWVESEDSRDLFHTPDLFRWPLSLDFLQHYITRIFHSQTALLFCSSLQTMFRLQQTTTAENTINKQGWNSRWAAALHYVQSKFSLETKYGWVSAFPPRQTWMNNEMRFINPQHSSECFHLLQASNIQTQACTDVG